MDRPLIDYKMIYSFEKYCHYKSLRGISIDIEVDLIIWKNLMGKMLNKLGYLEKHTKLLSN